MSTPQLRCARHRHYYGELQSTYTDTLAMTNEMLRIITNFNTLEFQSALSQQLHESNAAEEQLRTSLATITTENAALRKQLSEGRAESITSERPQCREVARMRVLLHNAGMPGTEALRPSPKCRCEPCLDGRDAELERLRTENQRLLNESNALKMI